jgi:hypothetical protein
MSLSWSLLGEVEVSDVWRLFPVDATSDFFRIKTTITDLAGWESLRIRSGAYIQFIYPNSLDSKSEQIFIPVAEDQILKELPIPQKFKDEGYVFRSVRCRLASRWVGKIDFISGFAKWNLRIEELL